MEQHGLASVDHYIFHSQLAGAFWPRGPLPVVFSGWMLVRSLVGMWGVLALRLEEIRRKTALPVGDRRDRGHGAFVRAGNSGRNPDPRTPIWLVGYPLGDFRAWAVRWAYRRQYSQPAAQGRPQMLVIRHYVSELTALVSTP